jgi:aspartyl-tRNA(Asn)/glutamyl-tRNA(Gln) amidotransferase subunit C
LNKGAAFDKIIIHFSAGGVMAEKSSPKDTPTGVPKVTVSDVAKVSTLARLQLDEAELTSLSETLSAVLANFEQIANIDTAGITPLVTPTDMTMSFREDKVSETLADSDRLLENAPEKSGRLFKVPPVV